MLSESAGQAQPELIEGCRRGDRAALEQVFRQQGPTLAKLLTRMVGKSADVDDLLQMTFAEAITAFPRFRGDASVRTWLSRIAVNVVRQSWRKNKTRRRAQLQLVEDAYDGTDLRPRIDDVASARLQLARVYEHLMKVGVKKRLAFSLHVLDARPLEEVAALTGATVAATRSRVYWARRALRASAKRDPLLSGWIERLEAAR